MLKHRLILDSTFSTHQNKQQTYHVKKKENKIEFEMKKKIKGEREYVIIYKLIKFLMMDILYI